MREPVQKSARLDMLDLKDDISVSSSRRSRNDIFIKREWDEEDEGQQIHYPAYCTHHFWASK